MDTEMRTDWLCERCGGVNVGDLRCPCRQPHDPVAIRRNHREAVRRAHRSDAAARRGARHAA